MDVYLFAAIAFAFAATFAFGYVLERGFIRFFYDRPDVLFVSLHGDPCTEYPFYLGHADETGEGAGAGKRATPRSPRRTVQGLLSQSVLHHLEGCALGPKAQTQIGHFRNGQTQVVGHDHGTGLSEDTLDVLDRRGFLCAVHCGLLVDGRLRDC